MLFEKNLNKFLILPPKIVYVLSRNSFFPLFIYINKNMNNIDAFFVLKIF